MNVVENLINTFKTRDEILAVKYFVVSHNDSITNEVREYLDSLDNEEILKIKDFLNHLLNVCYDGELFDEVAKETDKEILSLSSDELFLFKETVIYFIGRIKVLPDMEVLKKAYFLENNKHVKLNLAFTSLMTFDEEIELDFANLFEPGNEYDVMLRSWTMAFFANSDSPYDYVDTGVDDWNKAKMPRINRLSINDKNNPKYKKAMAFRLFDLLVLYIFLESRNETLSDDEKAVVQKADINFEKYSDEKIALLNDLKQKIILR